MGMRYIFNWEDTRKGMKEEGNSIYIQYPKLVPKIQKHRNQDTQARQSNGYSVSIPQIYSKKLK